MTTQISTTPRLLLLLCSMLSLNLANGFLPRPQQHGILNFAAGHHTSRASAFLSPLRATLSSDENNINNVNKKGPNENNNNNNEHNNDWSMEALRSRQAELTTESTSTEQYLQDQKWREADCQSRVQVTLPDWVRRLDVQYPLAACGTAKGTIYLTHLETGEILAKGHRDYPGDGDTKVVDGLTAGQLKALYGTNDGGGTVAIAFAADLIVEANRDGGVHFWRLDAGSTNLVYQGTMKALEGVLVTCLQLDDEYLWVASADGKLQAFPLDNNSSDSSALPLQMQQTPELFWQFRSQILSLSLTPDIGCGVVTTVRGTVELISMENDGKPICGFFPPYNYDDDDDDDETEEGIHALSGILVAHGEEDENGNLPYSIAVGGNDGSLVLQPLRIDEDGEVDEGQPFMGSLRRFTPSHKGAVKCLANPIPGMLISASHDGSMRVWDVATAHCIYQFVGYKVWLGSLWADGSRIISDGSDNTVIVHDFDKEALPEDSEDELDEFDDDYFEEDLR